MSCLRLQTLSDPDFDECEDEGMGNDCEQVCSNTVGGFSCSCFNGFELVNEAQCEGNYIASVHITM